MRKPVFRISDQVDTNQAVQSQKIVRDLKVRVQEVEGLYYQCSKNKGADQLRGYPYIVDIHKIFLFGIRTISFYYHQKPLSGLYSLSVTLFYVY